MTIKSILSALSLLVLGAVLFYIAGSIFSSVPALQITEDSRLPDGSRYYGEMSNGQFNGTGRIVWETGDEYAGEFKDGLFSGEGVLKFRNGDVYTGGFQTGFMQGSGRYTTEHNTIFEGTFIKDEFTGTGTIQSELDGYTYEGGVKSWHESGYGTYTGTDGVVYQGIFVEGGFTGQGIHIDEKKNKYTGSFKDWMLQGKGRYEGADGVFYEGDFESSTYKGKGTYTYANGDVYVGDFDFGLAHGTGTLTFAKAKENISGQAGEWKYGQFQDPELKKRRSQSKVRAESLLYVEQKRLDKALALIKSGHNGKKDLFFIGVGGDGSQQVFKREVEFAAKKMNQLYSNSGYSLQLVNTYVEDTSNPLATRISLQQSLNHIAEKMDTEEDILMLYITSHGSKNFSISLNQPGISLPNIKANELKDMLDKTSIKWKIIIVSACYSGGFIRIFENDNTLVITAADSKSKSFGCSDEAELTWFAKAFLRDSLLPGVGYREALSKAKTLIKGWEKKEGYKKPSNPQITMGSQIEKYLSTGFSKNSERK